MGPGTQAESVLQSGVTEWNWRLLSGRVYSLGAEQLCALFAVKASCRFHLTTSSLYSTENLKSTVVALKHLSEKTGAQKCGVTFEL